MAVFFFLFFYNMSWFLAYLALGHKVASRSFFSPLFLDCPLALQHEPCGRTPGFLAPVSPLISFTFPIFQTEM